MKGKQLHDVDGRKMTVDEIAAMLGLTVQALYERKHRLGGCSYQVIVDMARDGRIGGANDHYHRHLVDGRWITAREAAELVGVKYHTIRVWRSEHKGPDGKPPTMAEAVEHYRNFRRYGRKKRQGEKHWVKNREMTVAEAAAKYGAKAGTLYSYMHKRHCSLDTCIRRLESRRVKRAVKEIVGVIAGE